MEAEPAPDFVLRELQAPPCLDPKSSPEPRAQQTPRSSGFLRPNGRCVEEPLPQPGPVVRGSFWPAHQDSVTTLCFLQETPEASLARDKQALESCWEPKTLGTLGPPVMARDPKNMWTPINQQCCSLGLPGSPPISSASRQRKPRKQSNPHRGTEKVDPQFEGVTLRFQIRPDSSLQIIPSYSLACSSRSQGPPAAHPGIPEASSGGSEALGESRDCRAINIGGSQVKTKASGSRAPASGG
ncbi:GATA-type zinc finger protein 1, partial [Galemys pyrenaicus]